MSGLVGFGVRERQAGLAATTWAGEREDQRIALAAKGAESGKVLGASDE
jgi:hypothetical protein